MLKVVDITIELTLEAPHLLRAGTRKWQYATKHRVEVYDAERLLVALAPGRVELFEVAELPATPANGCRDGHRFWRMVPNTVPNPEYSRTPEACNASGVGRAS